MISTNPHLFSTAHVPIKVYPPPPSARKAFPLAVIEATKAHLSELDPTGARTRLFARDNRDAPHPGDVLLVTFTTGDPFAGVCLNIRRRGTDTAVLLRNRLLATGVEMWVKIYSPTVRSIEVVQRAEKRARRARLYYLRWGFFFVNLNLLPFKSGSESGGDDGWDFWTNTPGAGNRNTIAAASRGWWKRTYRTDG